MRAKAIMATVQAQRALMAFRAEQGKYTLTADAQAAWAAMLSDFLLAVEQSLNDLAETLALDTAGIVTLRKWWRAQRVQAAADNRAKALAVPKFIDDPDVAARR
jgi:hypothetical protein